MALTRTLRLVIDGDAKGVIGEFKNTGSEAEGLVGKLGGIGGAAVAGAAVAGAAVVGIGAALFKVGGDFQEQFNKITVGTGATGKALQGLETDFKNVLASGPDSMDKVGSAVTVLNQKLGLTGKPLEALSRQLLDVSRITKTDLSANIAAATGVFNQFHVSAVQQPEVLDELYRASQATGVGISDLMSQIASGGPVFQSLNFSVTDAAELVGQLGKAGLSASNVLPGLSKVLAVGAKEGKSAQQTYRDLVTEIKKAPDATAAAQIGFDTLGAKAGPKFAALVRSGQLSSEQLFNTIAEGSDTIDKSSKRVETFGEKWDTIKNRVLVALQPAATGVFNAIGDAMDKLGPIITNDVMPALNDLGGFISRYKPEFEALAGIIAGTLTVAFIRWGVESTIAAAKAVAGFVASQAQAIASIAVQLFNFALLIAGYVAIGLQAAATGVAMAAAWLVGLGPIAIVVAAVAAAAILIATHWNEILDAAKAVWDWISTNWPLILAILTGPIGLAVLEITRHWQGIKDGFTAVKTWIGDRIGDIVGFFTGLPGRISRATSGMWNGIKDAFRSALNWVIDKWNGLQFKIPSVGFGPFHTPSFTLGMPNVPRLAAGGIIQAQLGGVLAQLGEAGSNEAVLPLNSTGLRPLIDGLLDALRSAPGSAVGNQGTTFVVQVDATGANFVDPQAMQRFATALRSELEKIARRNGPASTAIGF